MSFKDDLFAASKKIFADPWSTTAKRVVPLPSDLGLGNDAGHFAEMTVLYADMDGSTKMVDEQTWSFSAEVYKAYLHCAAKIVKAQSGFITAYDGDRIMAVFTGDDKESRAVIAAAKINAAVLRVVNPAMQSVYVGKQFKLRHSVGIDSSEIHVARIGVRGEGDNDLVWVGRAANHAAKLTTLATNENPIWVSEVVYQKMEPALKNYRTGLSAWRYQYWTSMNNVVVYGTDGEYELD